MTTEKSTMFWKLLFLFSSCYALQQTLKEPACTNQGTSRTIRLSMNSKRNATGGWVDSLSGWTEVSNSSEESQTDVLHTITECQGKRVIHFHSLSHAPRYEGSDDKLRFHERCGKNIAVLNNGLSVQRLSFDDVNFASVFTDRPMRNDELFEIKMEGRKSTSGHDLGIGFMTKSPTDVDILPQMHKSPVVWIYHNIRLYNDAKHTQENIGKDTNTFQVGDRVGVMRSKMGTLHFFYNGKDQGPAMSNVPPDVYGILDLRGSFEKASIV